MYVNTSETNRRKAGRYAHDHLIGKGYNANFVINKSTTASRMNCSQLVWAAYKAGVNIGIDGNGGPGVYPKDIVDSPKTITWKRY